MRGVARRFGRALAVAAAIGLIAAAPASAGGTPTDPGSLDFSFGDNGLVVHRVDDRAIASAVAPGENGRFYVAGSTNRAATQDDFFVLRLTRNGARDTDFSGDGLIRIDFNGGDDQAFAMAVQDNGKVVVAGTAESGPDTGNDQFALARLKTNGKLDPNFSGDGRVRTDFNDGVSKVLDLALQDNGRIVAGGRTGASPFAWAMARYRSDGTLDPNFGKQTIPPPGSTDSAIQGVAVDEAGIYAGGWADMGGVTGYDFAVARLGFNGVPDTDFDDDGFATVGFNDSEFDAAYDLVLDGSGRPVLGGETDFGKNFDQNFAFARFETDGDLDTTFNSSGLQPGTESESFTDHLNTEYLNRLAIDADGKILAVGVSAASDNRDFALARLGANGGLDASFSPLDQAGMEWTSFLLTDTESEEATDLMVLPSGKILVVGWTQRQNGAVSRVGVARYLGG